MPSDAPSSYPFMTSTTTAQEGKKRKESLYLPRMTEKKGGEKKTMLHRDVFIPAQEKEGGREGCHPEKGKRSRPPAGPTFNNDDCKGGCSGRLCQDFRLHQQGARPFSFNGMVIEPAGKERGLPDGQRRKGGRAEPNMSFNLLGLEGKGRLRCGVLGHDADHRPRNTIEGKSTNRGRDLHRRGGGGARTSSKKTGAPPPREGSAGTTIVPHQMFRTYRGGKNEEAGAVGDLDQRRNQDLFEFIGGGLHRKGGGKGKEGQSVCWGGTSACAEKKGEEASRRSRACGPPHGNRKRGEEMDGRGGSGATLQRPD